MERGLSFGSRGPQSDFARLCWRVRIQNNNHQRHATTQGVSHAAVKHPARFRGLRAPHALYCAHPPNSAVKPTPTSSACGCPPCCALRRGLPRALVVMLNFIDYLLTERWSTLAQPLGVLALLLSDLCGRRAKIGIAHSCLFLYLCALLIFHSIYSQVPYSAISSVLLFLGCWYFYKLGNKHGAHEH